MNLSVGVRYGLTCRILRALGQAIPGSISCLRGSLARGTADEYSDIDVVWEVPDSHFGEAETHVGDVLSVVAPLESLRSDPAFQQSAGRRLFYVRFDDVPLFWRLDLDVFAQSIGRDDTYDRANALARGTVWSQTESALMNVVAAIKAHYRCDDVKAGQILQRGYERVGVQIVRQGLRNQLVDLVEAINVQDPSIGSLVERINSLINQAFPWASERANM